MRPSSPARVRRRLALSLLLLPLAAAAAATAAAAPGDKLRDDGLSWELHLIAERAERAERGASLRGLSRWLEPGSQRLSVVAELAPWMSASTAAATAAASGGRLDGFEPRARWARLTLPARALRHFSRQPGVELVRAPFAPSRKRVSEGVALIGSDDFSARTGADGGGVTVAVVDSNWQGVRERIAEGELPAASELSPGLLATLDSADSPHGVACAEIVHDVAPGASLLLAGISDEIGWSALLDGLAARGVRVVSHSLGFDNIYPLDGNNFFASVVDRVERGGVLFVTAAGNEADRYWRGAWSDPDGDGRLDFAPGEERLRLRAFAEGGTLVRLRWDDVEGLSFHDYDPYIVSADFAPDARLENNPAVLASSRNVQSGRGRPRELVELELDRDQDVFAVVVHDTRSTLKPDQSFALWTDGLVLEHVSAATSLTHPADARGAVAVGAAWVRDASVEQFSSQGPTEDGRTKPDLLGPDGVSTASYGTSGFFGTSASTPHAAGVAALLLSRDPSLGVAALRLQLERATRSGGDPARKNDLEGFGLLELRGIR